MELSAYGMGSEPLASRGMEDEGLSWDWIAADVEMACALFGDLSQIRGRVPLVVFGWLTGGSC